MSPDRRHRGGLGALRHPPFALYWSSRILVALAMEMTSTAIGWQVYRLTGSQFALGLVGLAQFAPFIVLFLVTGLVADRFSRVRILAACVALQAIGAAAFFALTYTGAAAFGPIMALLVMFGIARAFYAPLNQAMIPILIPPELFGNAVAWQSSGNQVSRIAGPSLGGLLIAVGTAAGVNEVPVYALASVLLAMAFGMTLFIRTRGQTLSKAPVTLDTLAAGLHFIWTRQVVFAAIALDLFAVLFGGATALLPVYARDILHVGAEGFGILRSALMAGAFLGALVLTQRPVTRQAGTKLLASVAVFGAGVVVFGVSTSFYLSLCALFVMGCADVVSVFIRHTMVQIVTPDEMRGRVGAVVGVFVGASNEVGEFESGLTASWWGTVPAVVVGGAATLVTAIAFAWRFPALRGMATLDVTRLVDRYRPSHDRHGRVRKAGP